MSPEPGSIAHTLQGPAQAEQCVKEQHNHDPARRGGEMREKVQRVYESVFECAQIIFLSRPQNCNKMICTKVF